MFTLVYGRKHADGLRFHTFQHSVASLALNAGIPEHLVQHMGNWKTRAMVTRYAHLADENMRDAAGKLALIVGRGCGVVAEATKAKTEAKAAESVSATGA